MLTARILKEINELWVSRWGDLHTHIHAAAYLVDPEHADDAHAWENRELVEGFTKAAEKLVPQEHKSKILRQLLDFRNRTGPWSRETIALGKELPSYQFWQMFGSLAPELSRFAIKVLSQTSTSSACERNWSTYDFIHNKRRNRLSSKRANDLVYVFSNLRLVERMKSANYVEEFPEWCSANVADADGVETDGNLLCTHVLYNF